MTNSQKDRELLLSLERRNKQLGTLVEIGKALTSTLDLDGVLSAIMQNAGLLLKSKSWSLLLLDETGQELTFEIAVSPIADQLKGQRIKLGEGVAGWVAQHGEPVLVADVRKDPRFAKRFNHRSNFLTEALVCVPVRIRERVFGVMELVNGPGDGAFDEEDLTILTAIADFAAIAIENARNFETIQRLSIIDELTGLYNARHMHELLDYEIERARRCGHELSLVFFDLDYFKQVNDSHGHLVGSTLLGQIGKLILTNIRRINHAARYGGDEFVILLPSASKEGAKVMAGHLHQILRKRNFDCGAGEKIRVTASFGLATYPTDAVTKEELVRKADVAMYQAKESGRDRVVAT